MTNMVLIERKAGYAIVTLNRPEALNALSDRLRADLNAAMRSLAEDGDVRVVILTGSGRAFCAGLDLKEIAEKGFPKFGDADLADPVRSVASFPGPVIVAVNGHAITGGFELALAGDVILASENASFADTHARVGAMPGWGLSQRLSRLIGVNRAKELSLTCRFVPAQEAERWGIVNRVVEPDRLLETAEEMAQAMLATAPGMIERLKAVIDDGYLLTLGEGLALEGERAQRFNEGARPA
ncbi:enoyl-CoA hydratase [Sphingobium indicum]|uniref:Enoyl-CoA hydratase n=2 Tax=Sphingobium indicum TaxID=332055 RepID=A0A8E0WPE1_9SPHN|nr:MULTISPECIES: enoyl-CoA hydratase [Sphingobium]EPR15223.1 enoyl-CoA hydratase [Sphingobium indicum IP26]EQB03041.1 enoyl-CoA hydratase [Sphingobium sp. HDIP04]KER34964.1 enoyl-CoA hydratase [Sphingobium indicum F2]KER35494.1 enoyl-CoA hydratase [Sphingobium indicum F2]NYI23558.1 enoyl-CoA hydratase [Sphingobium indicum]